MKNDGSKESFSDQNHRMSNAATVRDLAIADFFDALTVFVKVGTLLLKQEGNKPRGR